MGKFIDHSKSMQNAWAWMAPASMASKIMLAGLFCPFTAEGPN